MKTNDIKARIALGGDATMNILVDGTGTVGTNVLRGLRTLGIDAHATKHAIKEDYRTKTLARLAHDTGPVRVHVVRDDLAEQYALGKDLGLVVAGHREDIPLNSLDAVICCVEDDIVSDLVSQYKSRDIPFLIQGGSPHDLAGQDFLSAPNAIGETNYARLAGKSARQVSCNTTYASTALGLLLNLYTNDDISSVNIVLRRRCRDPHEAKPMLTEPSPLKTGTHHCHDIENVLPQLKGRITTAANTNPWEHYHRGELDITLNRAVTDEDLESVRNQFRHYDRCAYLERDIGGESTDAIKRGVSMLRSASEAMGIADGDCLLPTYTVMRSGWNSLRIAGYNPQRSIVTLSCLDWLHAKNGAKLWQEAYLQTNRDVRWFGHTLKQLKSGLETRLAQEVPYER